MSQEISASRQLVDRILVESNRKMDDNILFGFPVLISCHSRPVTEYRHTCNMPRHDEVLIFADMSASGSEISSHGHQVTLLAMHNRPVYHY